MIVPLITIGQRTEDSQIVIKTEMQNPLIILELLMTAQQQFVAQARATMEVKRQIIEPASNIIT